MIWLPVIFLYIIYPNNPIFQQIGNVVGGTGVMIIFITVIALVSMFVYKLVQAYRCMNDEEIIISVITRIVILGSISSPLSVAPSTAYGYAVRSGTEIGELMSNSIHVIVFFTNCMCFLLSFSYYKSWYERLCGCLDKRCFNYWSKLAKGKEMEKNIPDLTDVDSKSGTVNSSDQTTIV